MFTGLVEECGEVVRFVRSSESMQLTVRAPAVSSDATRGDSIAVNGCCLTLARQAPGELVFDLLEETAQRTNLAALDNGAPVNLERALAVEGRVGGHFVQGHIDCTSEILALEQRGNDHRLQIKLPREFAGYVAFKGSIAVDGISLTVAEANADNFVAWIIPHTLAMTNLRTRSAGDLVNLEFDLLAKYVARILAFPTPG